MGFSGAIQLNQKYYSNVQNYEFSIFQNYFYSFKLLNSFNLAFCVLVVVSIIRCAVTKYPYLAINYVVPSTYVGVGSAISQGLV